MFMQIRRLSSNQAIIAHKLAENESIQVNEEDYDHYDYNWLDQDDRKLVVITGVIVAIAITIVIALCVAARYRTENEPEIETPTPNETLRKPDNPVKNMASKANNNNNNGKIKIDDQDHNLRPSTTPFTDPSTSDFASIKTNLLQIQLKKIDKKLKTNISKKCSGKNAKKSNSSTNTAARKPKALSLEKKSSSNANANQNLKNKQQTVTKLSQSNNAIMTSNWRHELQNLPKHSKSVTVATWPTEIFKSKADRRSRASASEMNQNQILKRIVLSPSSPSSPSTPSSPQTKYPDDNYIDNTRKKLFGQSLAITGPDSLTLAPLPPSCEVGSGPVAAARFHAPKLLIDGSCLNVPISDIAKTDSNLNFSSSPMLQGYKQNVGSTSTPLSPLNMSQPPF